MDKRVLVDQSKFNCVKTLLAGGASNSEAAEYMKLSPATISRIKAAADWQEYRNMLAAMALETKKRAEKKKLQKQAEAEKAKLEEKQVETPVQEPVRPIDIPVKKGFDAASSYQVNRMIEEMKRQNDILTCISNKIAFIVDELTK